MGSHWLSEFKNMMEKFEKAYLLNGNERHCSPQFTTISEVGVCCKFTYQLRPVSTLNPTFPSPMLQPVGSFQNAASIKSLPLGTFNGFPALLLECLWPHLMLWGTFATSQYFHPKTLHSSHLRSIFAPSLCPYLVCSAPQIFAWLPPPRGSSGKTFSTTQTHLGTSTVYSLLALIYL